jgi:hypothetical protein
MRNKNFILGVGFILIVAITAIVGVFLYNPDKKTNGDESAPFGDTSALRENGDSETAQDNAGNIKDLLAQNSSVGQPAPLLHLLSESPVSGAGTYQSGTDRESPEFVRYVDKNTGNIKETPLATIGTVSTVSEKTLLRTSHSVWSSTGSSTLILRLNDSADTVFGYLGLVEQSTEGQSILNGRPLPNEIISAAFSPAGTALAYLLPSGTGSTLFTENTRTGVRTELWSSPLQDLTVRWDGGGILVYTNPTSYGDGVVWHIDSNSGKQRILLGGEVGLAAKQSFDGSKTLYSFIEPSGVQSLRVRTEKTNEVVYLPMATIVDKCTWSTVSAEFVYCAVPRTPLTKESIDGIYKGAVSTDDVLWQFNVATGEATQLADLYEEAKVRLDVEYPTVSHTGKYLLFQTRKNDYLWGLQLPEVTAQQPTATTTQP